MRVESRSDELLVPCVFGHTGCGAVDGDDAAALLDPVPEGAELWGGEEVWAEGLEEHDGFVGGKIGECEDSGVRGAGDADGGVLVREALEERDAGGDRGVAVAGCFVEDEDGEGLGSHC